MAAETPLAELKDGDRVRVQGGRNFDKFHGGMEATILENNPENKNMRIQFDDVGTSGPEPISVAYRHLEFAPNRGAYRAGSTGAGAAGNPAAQAPNESQGPLVTEHGAYYTRQLVQLHGLQSDTAKELNGKVGRLRKFDTNADRWEVDVRGQGIKRLKEENLCEPSKPEVEQGLSVEELKGRGNDGFKEGALELAVAYYTAAIDALGLQSDSDAEEAPDGSRPPEAADRKYIAVLYGNRGQCHINLCREVNGEDRVVSKEARGYAMRANMDSAKAVELDPMNGKAYYRRGCAVLGMAPSASRAKEAIHYLEVALTGRASGAEDGKGMVLPNAMRNEVSNLLDYAKRRLDACVEAAVPDVEACRENCKQS